MYEWGLHFYLEDRVVTTLSCQVNNSITIVVHIVMKNHFEFTSFVHSLHNYNSYACITHYAYY